MNLRRLAGLNDILEAGMWMRHDQVVIEGSSEKDGFLRHNAERGSEFIRGQVADVFAVQVDLSFVWLIETEQQFGQGAFAATAGAHQNGEVARFEGEA